MEHNIFGTTFYEGTGSKDKALTKAINKEHKILVAWQKNEKNYLYGSYINKNIFINNLIKTPEKDRKFYEVLTGFVNTYVDLEWTDDNIFEEDVIKNFETLFKKVFVLIDPEVENGNFYWSISSDESKKSLHLNYVNKKCWKNTKEQNIFWKYFKECLYNLKDDCPQFFYLEEQNNKIIEKCIIDFGVYTTDRQWRTIFSHKDGSKRILKPCGSFGNIFYDDLEKFNNNMEIENWITNYQLNRNQEPEFYELPERINNIPDYKSIEIGDDELEQIISNKIPNTRFKNIQGNLVILSNVGIRKCIINGEENHSDNSYLIIKKDGFYFGCHDENCKGKLKKIHNIEASILDNDIKYFQGWRKLKLIKNITYNHIVEFCKRTVGFIVNGGNGFWVTKNLKDNDIHFEIIKNINNDSLSITFINSYEKDGELIEEKFNLISILKSIKDEIAFDYFDFIPYSPIQIKNNPNLLNEYENSFNLFTGFKARYIWDLDGYYNEYYKKVIPIFDHIKNIMCGKNERIYNYILDWIAHLFQYPNKKIGIMIVLKSIKQGAGKNIIFDFIRDYVYGEKYCLEINNMEQLTGKFNSLLQNKLLTLADEVGMFGTDHRNSDKLKNIITQPKQNIEKKGMDSFKINDYNNFIALTNNDWAFKIEAGDRRHICLELSDEKVDNQEYFNKIGECFNNECGNIFYSILLNRDISKWEKNNIPMTKMKRELKLNSAPKTILFIIDIIEQKEKINLDSQNRIHQCDLFNIFKQWLNNNGYNDNYNSRRFKLDLEKIKLYQLCAFKIHGAKKVGYKIDIEFCKNEIRNFLKDPEFEFLQNDEDIIEM